MQKFKRSLVFVAAIFAMTACDRVCVKSVQLSSNIQNMTGRALSLNLCRGPLSGEGAVTLSVDTQMNEVDLGVVNRSEVTGGPASSCAKNNASKEVVAVTLAPSSFGQVKLCYQENSKESVIVDNSQMCPTGFVQQTSSEVCDKGTL